MYTELRAPPLSALVPISGQTSVRSSSHTCSKYYSKSSPYFRSSSRRQHRTLLSMKTCGIAWQPANVALLSVGRLKRRYSSMRPCAYMLCVSRPSSETERIADGDYSPTAVQVAQRRPYWRKFQSLAGPSNPLKPSRLQYSKNQIQHQLTEI